MTSAPDYATPTGAFIAEWMGENAATSEELAARIGIVREHLDALLEGTATLDPALAVRLERATSVPARIWNRYETLYRHDRERLAAATAAHRASGRGDPRAES